MRQTELIADVREMLADRICNQLQALLSAESETERYSYARRIRAVIESLSSASYAAWKSGNAPELQNTRAGTGRRPKRVAASLL